MSNKSAIEWTEQTWNPTAGCTKISPGCANCYAEVMANRLQAMGTIGYENGFQLSLVPSRLDQPTKRKKPTVYFVNSMSDVFHEDIPDDYLDEIFAIISKTQQHTYQILTKRSGRMRDYLINKTIPDNVWLGVTVENIEHGLPRIAHLREVEAKVRFLSCEPLLQDLGKVDLSYIHWVIVGGESGANARPMQKDWVSSLKKQCEKQRVAFFFKQWGMWGADGRRRSKKANGRLLYGKTWSEYPRMSISVV
jgi:protein gp37